MTDIDPLLSESHQTLNRLRDVINEMPDDNLRHQGRPVAVVLFMHDGYIMVPAPSNAGSPEQTLKFCRCGFNTGRMVVNR